jgi:hypothetical protein
MVDVHGVHAIHIMLDIHHVHMVDIHRLHTIHISGEGGAMARATRDYAQDLAQVRETMDAGITGSRAIARRTNIPESTVRRRLKEIALARARDGASQAPARQEEPPTNEPASVPAVIVETPVVRFTSSELESLKAMLHWWQQREARAQQPQEPRQDLVRWTIYLAAPYKEAIEAEAEAERVSITTVINRAVASYLARMST